MGMRCCYNQLCVKTSACICWHIMTSASHFGSASWGSSSCVWILKNYIESGQFGFESWEHTHEQFGFCWDTEATNNSIGLWLNPEKYIHLGRSVLGSWKLPYIELSQITLHTYTTCSRPTTQRCNRVIQKCILPLWYKNPCSSILHTSEAYQTLDQYNTVHHILLWNRLPLSINQHCMLCIWDPTSARDRQEIFRPCLLSRYYIWWCLRAIWGALVGSRLVGKMSCW
jgi:hypothetical protein